MLNLVQWQTRLLGDGLERQDAIVRVTLEHGFNESHKANLLSKEGIVLLQDRLGGEDGGKGLKLADVTLVEG